MSNSTKGTVMEKKWFAQSLESVESSINVKTGLTSEAVEKSRAQYGDNKLREGKKKSLLQRLIAQFSDMMIIILMIAAIISFIMGERIDAIVILAIVILNAAIGLIQEGRAESSLKALQDMSSPSAKVIRESEMKIIPSKEIVVGDLLVLEAGDLVSADVRLLQTSSLQVQEASLTGESLPVEKHADAVCSEDAVLGDRVNMAYSSGMVTYGRGLGLVVSVGMETEVGKIATLLESAGETQTPLQKQLNQLGKVLGVAALIACGLIFAIGLLYRVGDGITLDEIAQMFLIAVSLAVAVIPEGLPAVSTIVLAMGVQRLVDKHAIIRTLPSVETLGSATVICSDKTGTLTQNKMTVVEYWNDDHKDASRELALASLLCNDSRLVDGAWVGDPTETALSEWAAKLGFDTQAELKDHHRVNEVPFDSGRKRMTTINTNGNEFVAYTKGGVDEVLAVSKFYGVGDEIHPINPEEITRILDANEQMAKKALRVLAIASKPLATPLEQGDATVESDLIFRGLVGMIDPPRPEVIGAIQTCKEAGIQVVMITGDHALTAGAIASQIGLLDHRKVVTGAELKDMDDEQLYEDVQNIGVYARVSPEDKMRIISAWQRHGDIVAMTGDGVNDAPALKKADIGAAMGIVGTEVAKSAADMILTDDNFATVVTAVGEGRRIKDNIMKAVNYLLSCNVGELLTLLVATLLNLGTPLQAIHILWINLVTDSLPALALGVDPAEDGIMKRNPDRGTSILNKARAFRILYQGVMVGGLTLFAYLWGSNLIFSSLPFNEQQGQTMAFIVLAFSQLVHAYNIHSPHQSVFKTFTKNKWLLLATLVNSLMMFAVILIPGLRTIFGLASFDLVHLEVTIILILLPLPIVELMKLLKLNGEQ